jgi:Yip1 domain
MQSNNLFLDDDDDDVFGSNPFRSQQQQQQVQQQQQQQQQQHVDPFAAIHGSQQPDPISGMVGSVYVQPSFPPNQSSWLDQQPPMQQPQPSWHTSQPDMSGTMDNRLSPNNSRHSQSMTYGSDGVPNGGALPPNTPWYSWRRCFACTRIDAWAAYFDVDTAHIQHRLMASLTKFHERDQFRTAVLGDAHQDPSTATSGTENDGLAYLRSGPDLYGPVWIATTLVFLIGVTTNLSAYVRHASSASPTPASHQETRADNTTVIVIDKTAQDEEFEYDLRHLQRAMTVIFTFAFVLPTFFWFISSCCLQLNVSGEAPPSTPPGSSMVPALTWVMWICVYGYALTPYLIAASVAWIPILIVEWLALALGTAASGLLVIRNLSTPLLANAGGGVTQRAEGLILAILAAHFIFMCVLKFGFYAA